MDDEFDAEEQKLYEELYNLMGAKIRFKCDDYLQEGIIHTIKPGGRRVFLKNVYFILPDKRVFSGMLKYRFSDLEKYEVVATAKELNPYPKNEYIANLLKNHNVGKKYSINDLFFGGMLSEESDDDEENDESKAEEEFKFDIPDHLRNKVPCDSVIIDDFDLEWKQAIKHIGLQKVIGVSFHGYKVSRLGKFSWVCISTSWCVFLFDIEKLGGDAFSQGLKGIFEKGTIKKIIHDCRFPSDCLAHKYDTKLVSVFDTLVSEFVISMQFYNDKHKYNYVQNLNSCLRAHLHIEPEFLYSRDRILHKDGEINYLSKRPVSNDLRYVLVKDTVYLPLLHETFAKKLLGPLHLNVDRYLKVIAGATRQEFDTLREEISSPDSIPPALLMYGIQTVQFHKPQKKPAVSLECGFINPITGKLVNVKEPSSSDVSDKNKSDKENRESKDKVRQQKLPVLHRSVTVQSSELEKKSAVVNRMVVKPGGRHIDEVYHRLVNGSQFHADNPENITNVKPRGSYMSKFTMRLPLECSAFSEQTCNNGDIHTSKPVVEEPKKAERSTDYSDIWAKCREAFEGDSPRYSRKSKPFKFVPSGMSC